MNDDVRHLLSLHGGQVQPIAKHYGLAADQVIDLSTGISPYGYPFDVSEADINAAIAQLPYDTAGFYQAVRCYFGDHAITVGPGSQYFIEQLPYRLSELPVLLPQVGYEEHAKHWRKSGRCVLEYLYFDDAGVVKSTEHFQQDLLTQAQENTQSHCVLINPNNPAAQVLSATFITCLADTLDGVLIVDEAFMDVTPDKSLLSEPLPNNVIILRSLGKFFGLAGLRVGFALCNKQSDLCAVLQDAESLWAVSGLSIKLAESALNNVAWQHDYRQKLVLSNKRQLNFWHAYLGDVFAARNQNDQLEFLGEVSLFMAFVVPLDAAIEVFERLARLGVLVRVIDLSAQLSAHLSKPFYDQQAIIRFGLCKNAEFDEIERRLAS